MKLKTQTEDLIYSLTSKMFLNSRSKWDGELRLLLLLPINLQRTASFLCAEENTTKKLIWNSLLHSLTWICPSESAEGDV